MISRKYVERKVGFLSTLAHMSTVWRSKNQSGYWQNGRVGLASFYAASMTNKTLTVVQISGTLFDLIRKRLLYAPTNWKSIRYRSVRFDVVYACLQKLLRLVAECVLERYNKWQTLTGASWWQCVWGPRVLLCCMKHSQQTFRRSILSNSRSLPSSLAVPVSTWLPPVSCYYSCGQLDVNSYTADTEFVIVFVILQFTVDGE
jgi:hypothetical protein